MFTKLLFLLGIVCLGVYGMFTIEAHVRQADLEEELFTPPLYTASMPRASAETIHEGDLFGRLEIPRLDLSVMIMEGDSDRTLRLGAGRIPGVPLAIAGHRDSFF